MGLFKGLRKIGDQVIASFGNEQLSIATEIGIELSTSSTTGLSAGSYVAVANLSIPKGIWLLSGRTYQGDFTAARQFTMNIQSTAAVAGSVTGGNQIQSLDTYNTGAGSGGIGLSNVYAVVNSTTTYYLNVRVTAVNGANTCEHFFQAVKIGN